jgi:hypothetical protein
MAAIRPDNRVRSETSSTLTGRPRNQNNFAYDVLVHLLKSPSLESNRHTLWTSRKFDIRKGLEASQPHPIFLCEWGDLCCRTRSRKNCLRCQHRFPYLVSCYGSSWTSRRVSYRTRAVNHFRCVPSWCAHDWSFSYLAA